MANSFNTTSAASSAYAGNSYTLADLERAVKHAVGGEMAATLTAAEVVNDALGWLVARHEWSWLERDLSLNFVADQSFVNLPADFRSLSTLVRNSTLRECRGATLHEIRTLRATAAGVCGELRYAHTIAPQASATVAPVQRLEIWPTPSANETAALVGSYTRLVPKLVGSTAVADIPSEYHRILKYACRAHAIGQHTQEAAEDWRYLEAEMGRLVEQDGLRQDSLGPMAGAVDRMRGGPGGPAFTISYP